MLNRRLDRVVTFPDAIGCDAGLVGQLVLDATEEGDGLLHDALEVFPAVDELEGVANVVLGFLVAAGSEEASGHIETSPVEGVLVVLGLVDELWPDLLPFLQVPLCGNAEVELVADFEVHGRLHSGFTLVVVLNSCL